MCGACSISLASPYCGHANDTTEEQTPRPSRRLKKSAANGARLQATTIRRSRAGRSNVRSDSCRCAWLGTTWKQPRCPHQPQEHLHQRLRCANPTGVRVCVHEEKKATRVSPLCQACAPTMGACPVLHRQWASTSWQEGRRILPPTQEDAASRV